MDLVEFLLARIAEDEELAQLARQCGWKWVTQSGMVMANQGTFPARILAECDAKRRIVDAYREERSRRDIYWRADEGELNDEDRKRRQSTTARTRGLEIAVEALALPYADHPDYQKAWRP